MSVHRGVGRGLSAHDFGERFLKHLPRIEAHAKFASRRIGCPHARAELQAETLGLAWKYFVALVNKGKTPNRRL